MPPLPGEVAQRIERLIKAMNHQQSAVINGLIGEGFQLHDVASSTAYTGSEGPLMWLEVFRSGLPDVSLHAGTIIVNPRADSASAEVMLVGTHTRHIETIRGRLAPTGLSVNLVFGIFWALEGEHITCMTVYYNAMTLANQLLDEVAV